MTAMSLDRQHMRAVDHGTTVAVRLGALAWVLAAQFYVAQVVVASAWTMPFSMKTRVISDLGNTAGSPWHAVMNASFIIVGITMAAGAILTHRFFTAGWQRTLAAVLFVAAGIGVLMVGVYPENENGSLHAIGAGINFVSGNSALILFGLAAQSPPSRPFFTWFSIIAGIAGLTATVLFGMRQDLGLGMGGIERVAAYTTTTWQIAAGLVVLGRTRTPARRP
jgi:hypothetical membrane protein